MNSERDKEGWVVRYDNELERKVKPKIVALEAERHVYLQYRQVCLGNNDHHGVQDASSDLREIEAKIEVLKWVLG